MNKEQTHSSHPTLGILGGLGPMSGIYFCEMLTSHTHALCDAEHINFILSSRADTPDRSSFILGTSKADPAPIMVQEAKRLEKSGADMLAIPCNTAHYFYDRICSSVDIPVINIICETARFCKYSGFTKIGVLATEGTASCGAYSHIFSGMGMEIFPLTREEQDIVTDIIFGEIKRGAIPSPERLLGVGDSLVKRGCEKLILGCTELSLLNKYSKLPPVYADSLELLALAAIKACKKTPIGFDAELMNFYGSAEKG